MDCVLAEREERLESYVLNELSEGEREELEAHYFSCDACLERLETLLLAREELARQREAIEAAETKPARPASWVWLVAAALVLAAVGGGLWLRAQLASGALKQLAQIEPPRYEEARLRGPEADKADLFRRAMAAYVQGDYAAAIRGLEASWEREPGSARVSFFLAACHLLRDDIGPGIEWLERTLAAGDTPYQEEAHLLLAKAYLKKEAPELAIAELERAVALEGDFESTANELLRAVRELRGARP